MLYVIDVRQPIEPNGNLMVLVRPYMATISELPSLLKNDAGKIRTFDVLDNAIECALDIQPKLTEIEEPDVVQLAAKRYIVSDEMLSILVNVVEGGIILRKFGADGWYVLGGDQTFKTWIVNQMIKDGLVFEKHVIRTVESGPATKTCAELHPTLFGLRVCTYHTYHTKLIGKDK